MNNNMRTTAELIVEAQKSNQPSVISLERTQFLFKELQVHQIELQMQNEELRRNHDALAQAKERYVDLYELAPISYIILDEEGTILESNVTAAKLFALPKNILINSPLTTFIFSEDQDIFYHHRRELLISSEGKSCTLRFIRGGELFWARLDSTHLLSAQNTVIWHLTLSDITEQKKIHEDLIIAKETAELANKRNSDIISKMSRNIQTSLNEVMGLTNLVLESNLESLQRAYLIKLQLEVTTLLTSIESKFE